MIELLDSGHILKTFEEIPDERFFVVPLTGDTIDPDDDYFRRYYVAMSIDDLPEGLPANRRPKRGMDPLFYMVAKTTGDNGVDIWVDFTTEVVVGDPVIELNFSILYPEGANVRLTNASGQRSPDCPTLFRIPSREERRRKRNESG